MRNEQLLHAFGQINEKFIDEANPEKKREKRKKEARSAWVKWGAMAACMVLVLGGAFAVAMNGQKFKAVDELGNSEGQYNLQLTPEVDLEGMNQAVDGTVTGTEVVPTEEDVAMYEGVVTEETWDTVKDEVGSKGDDAATNGSVKYTSAERTDWGLTLSAKNVTSTGMTLVITQSGGAPTGRLQYGSDYHLKVLKDGKWVDVPYAVEGDVAWTAEAYMVMMEDSVETELQWERLYGSLEAGTYRISKGFMDFRTAGDYDSQSFYAEFEVK